MQPFRSKVQKGNFFADPFRKWKNSLGTNNRHMQSTVGRAKEPSFLAIFCSSICARLLVHVGCPLIWIGLTDAGGGAKDESPRDCCGQNLQLHEHRLSGRIHVHVVQHVLSHMYSDMSTGVLESAWRFGGAFGWAPPDLCLPPNGYQNKRPPKLGAYFREGDEDSNFSLFRVRRLTESPGPLHWIASPLEILTKPPIHWIASPLFSEKTLFFTEKCFVAKDQLRKMPSNKKLAVLIPIRFDNPLGAAKKTPKRVPKQTGSIKMPNLGHHLLISFWMLTIPWTLLQASISFCSVSDKSGALLFCLVRINMPLLIYPDMSTEVLESHALRKFVVNRAPNLRKIVGSFFRDSEEGCKELLRFCRKLDIRFPD